MKFASFSYSRSCNIGDEIQSIATMNLLPRVDLFVERDALDEVAEPEAVAVVMNGWFSDAPEHWPPAACVRPIFVGFHMTSAAAEEYGKAADYFRRHGPIGCRDHGTARKLREWQVEAYTSYCCTLTFPRRERSPALGKTILVDAGSVYVPSSLRRNAIQLSHMVGPVSHDSKLQYARDLLQFYRDEAALVITTRLHCALPCMAMGIPVVFFGKTSDYRVNIVDDVGGRTYDRRLYKRAMRGIPGRAIHAVDWAPPAVDVSGVAQAIGDDVRQRIERLR
jgi:hypothetical protein